jgi:HEAT repeat protein
MEILTPNLLDAAIKGTIALAALSLLLLLLVIGLRWQSDRRSRRFDNFRKTVQPVVMLYINGEASEAEAVTELSRDEAFALTLLMEVHGGLDPDKRGKLVPLFDAFPFVERETHKLKSRRTGNRLHAAERLGYIGNKVAVKALVIALTDKMLDVRLAAARSLVMLGRTETLERIILALDIPGEMSQRRVAEVIFGFGSAAEEPLLAILDKAGAKYSDTVITVAARVLGMLHSKKSVSVLTRLLRHPDNSVRINCIRALGLIGDAGAVSAISPLVDAPSWEVRNVAAQALGKLHAVAQIPVLENALGDPSWWVRHSAAEALHTLGDPGLASLKKAMNDHPDRYGREMTRQILQEHRILETTEVLQ